MFASLLKDMPCELFPEFLPLEEILYDNRTIATKNHSIAQVIRLQGLDYQGLSYEQIEYLHTIRRNLFANEALADKVKFTFFSQRKEVLFEHASSDYSGSLKEIADLYQEHFKQGYITETSIVVYMPLGKIITRKTGIPGKDYREENILLRKKVLELTNIVQGIISLLKEYDAKPLMHTQDSKSPLLHFWMYLANGGKTRVASKQNGHVSNHISFSDVEFYPKKRTICFDDGVNKTYSAFLSLNAYPSETTADIFDSLMQLQKPISLIQTFTPTHPEKTKKNINYQIRNLMAVRGFIGSRLNDLEEAASLVENNEVNFHGHCVTICVYATSEAELDKTIHEVEKIMAPSGIHLIREGWNLHGCFYGQFPDGEKFMEARKVNVTPDNLSQFITFTGGNEGHRSSPFGAEPVTTFKKTDGSIYNFTWHPNLMPDIAGHTFLCGASGSGKTVLAMFLIGMSLKYKNEKYGNPLKTLLFDSGKGAKIPTLAFDGDYHTIMQDEGVELNPLSLNDTISNREFLQQFFEMLAGGDLNEKERSLITEAIRQNYQLPESDRYLHEIQVALGQQGFSEGRGTLKSKLSPWLLTKGERNPSYTKRVFNGSRDTLAFDSQIVGFDMSQVLKDKKLLAPLSAYIFHKFNTMVEANPTPHIIFIDEAVQYLEHPLFGDYVLKMIREQRKKNGVVVLAGQEPSVLTGSKNGQAALHNIETFIIWPNHAANPADYMEEGLGLNEREFEWVKHPRGKREVMLKRKNGGSVILNIDLSCLGPHLHILASGTDKVRLAEELILSEADTWLSEYLNHFIQTNNI